MPPGANSGRRELGARGLVLLRLAGHDGDDDQVLGLHADLLGVVALGDRAEHLLRALAGARDVQQVREVVLEEVDPARAARGEDRQARLLLRVGVGLAGPLELEVLLHAADELVALLHDGEVGGEVGVEHLVEPEHAERGDELAGDRLARLEAELLADRDADRGRGLDDDRLLRVVDRGHDLLGVADAHDGPDGADVDALAAEGAGAVRERDHRGGADLGGEAAAVAGERADGLHLVADGLAAAAHDALAQVAHDRGALVHRIRVALALVGDLADAELGGEPLQLALLVLGAGEAVLRVVREEQLHERSSSRTVRRAFIARALFVQTSMLGATGVAQAGARILRGPRMPVASTRQRRQLAGLLATPHPTSGQ